MGIIAVCLMLFAIFLLMYGALRDMIMVNTPGSVFLGVIWNYLGSAATLCVEIAIIFKYVNYIRKFHAVNIQQVKY